MVGLGEAIAVGAAATHRFEGIPVDTSFACVNPVPVLWAGTAGGAWLDLAASSVGAGVGRPSHENQPQAATNASTILPTASRNQPTPHPIPDVRTFS
jgi:hypothetical protein